MRQTWHTRARTIPTGRRRAAGPRRIHLAVAVGLALVLGACDAQQGTEAVLTSPRPIAADRDHRPQPAPKQRWGTAAGLDPVVDGPRNTYKPPSLRSRYPVLKTPAAPANT
ncbi:MAG TPA: hypothetical protein VFH03_13485, partial [Actinoplanes sp.]|nr:hypothetical protein [Actinoplanes sp.]